MYLRGLVYILQNSYCGCSCGIMKVFPFVVTHFRTFHIFLANISVKLFVILFSFHFIVEIPFFGEIVVVVVGVNFVSQRLFYVVLYKNINWYVGGFHVDSLCVLFYFFFLSISLIYSFSLEMLFAPIYHCYYFRF